MSTGIDPKVDYVFKKIFGSEVNISILLDILNAVLRPPANQELVALSLLTAVSFRLARVSETKEAATRGNYSNGSRAVGAVTA